MSTVKAITIRSPWAAWIFTPHSTMGLKDVENRTWQTKHRGVLAIHAGQRLADGFTESDVDGYRAERRDHTAWARGAVIGVVDLVDIAPAPESPWAMPEHYHWRLANPRLLPIPIQMPGRLHLFDLELGGID